MDPNDKGPKPDVWLTMRDGLKNLIWNPKTGRTREVYLGQHAMRFHIYDGDTNTATVHYVNTNEEFFRNVRHKLSGISGMVFRASTWITVMPKRAEFYPALEWQRLAWQELTEIGGWKSVEITGCAIRNIKYVSDGNMSRTPDAIGRYGGKPLVYKGYTVAVIFKLNGQDVLKDSNNVVYLLPRKWWNKFHGRYRKIPKDFPSPGRLGFVCTNWCQRHGHSGYSEGIYIASMTQNHSLGTWASSQLRNYWKSRGGIAGDVAEVMKVNKAIIVSEEKSKSVTALALAVALHSMEKQEVNIGKIGSICIKCGAMLSAAFAKCHICSFNNDYGTIYQVSMKYSDRNGACTKCGLPNDDLSKHYNVLKGGKRCTCEEGNPIKVSQYTLENKMFVLEKKRKEIIKQWN